MAPIICYKLLQPIHHQDAAGNFSNMKQLICDCRTIGHTGDVTKSHSPFVVAVPEDQLIMVVAKTGMFRSMNDDDDNQGSKVRILVFAGSDFRLNVKVANNAVSVRDHGYCFSESLKSFTEKLDPSNRQVFLRGEGLYVGTNAVVPDSQPPSLEADPIDLSKGSSPENAIIID
ncbi:hypothetical protein ColLi_12316 [Colletotrichum liriopes]|uniref:Uncharacterized protein n=1 Tax=Colletotrichum liriopes TaxID=708192 RepID=A0AA37GY63_9PEZI|nr:hypothetical protein ColLi_12316 [Colletotrichum liriopes]